MKKMLALLLTLCLLAGLLPVTALADGNVSYVDENGATKTCDSATKVQSSDDANPTTPITWPEGWYVVNGDVTIASRITVTGTVNLILADGKTLTAQKGIYVGSGSSLTIYGQSEGTGQLNAQAYQVGECAGIGGNTGNEAAHGNITINGGVIMAKSFGGGAGIGSGSGKGNSNKPNGTITINGGKVTATAGGSNGAGIGGGYFNKIAGGNIVINGGTVNATGGVKAAGIGSGYSDWQESNGRSITISGDAVVEANGGSDAAGIGGGYGCKAASITSIIINGGNVTATGGDRGAGIGSGFSTAMTTSINIGGDAVVEAKGGGAEDYGGAGIGSGGGTSSKIGDITISGGNVTATGGTATDSDMHSGAGIGSGGYSKDLDENYRPIPATGDITISGGTVTATGGSTDAAGIGNGKSGVGGDFSTGTDGQAVIYASSITDTITSDWSGIIFQGSNGQVYGEVTLTEDMTLESGQTLEIPEGSSLTVPDSMNLNAASGTLTNDGTLTILGTVTGTITGDGAVVRDTKENDSVASYGSLYYSTLEAAINAANGAADGGTVTLLKDATLSTPLDEDVTLSVSSAVLTVETTGLTNLAKGTLEIKQGGALKLDSNILVGSGGTLNLTRGSVTMANGVVTLTSDSEAEIPSGKTFYLMLGKQGPALNAVIEQGATLTVANGGTLKAVSGTPSTGSKVTVKGTLDVKGTLTIALQADVTVENGGTLNLPLMTKAAMGNTADGWGMKGDIIVNSGANLTYASNDVLGGDNPLMTLTSGTATLNLGNANATEPSVSLTLNGKASVASNLKALWVTADDTNTFVPMNITVASGSEATVPAGKVLNLVNGSSLAVADDATFTVAENGILEVHSTAKFNDTATVSGKIYVFEAEGGTNPISGASINLTKTGAVYAEKTELSGTNIAPAQMAASTEKYISTSGGGEKTSFAKQWTFSYKITLDPNGGTLAGGTSELWTGTDGKLTAMPSNPTYSGYTFNGWYRAATGGSKVATNTVFDADTTIYAQWSKKSSGTVTPTPPRPTEEKHSITISTDGKGQVTGPASAAEDDKVTLTVKPNADKELYDLKVTDENGKAIAVTKVNDTTYTFTMPDGKVTVAATFGCDGGDNCPSKAFTDLGDKQWYHDSIDYAVENGLLEGTSPTTMEPNATLIRAQLAQILYNIEDKPAVTGEMVFEDVPASEWFYSPVLWANQNDIINGTSPTTFEPLEDISRQDLALMLYRYAGKPAVTGDLDGFTDADQVGDWADEAMAWAVAEGIVQGDTPTTLNPTGTATRAEAAAMLQRFLENAA